MTDNMDAASEERIVTKLEMSELNGCISTEIEGSKGLLIADGDPGSSSNKLDVNDNGFVISPGIRDERTAVFDGRKGLSTKEMSDTLLMEPDAGNSLLISHVLEGSSDAPGGGKHLGVFPEVTDGFASASLGRDDVRKDFWDLLEGNNSFDVASGHSNHLMDLSDVTDGSNNASEHNDHLMVLPKGNNGLDIASEHNYPLMVLPKVNNGLDIASEHNYPLMVLPEVQDSLNDAFKISDLPITPGVGVGLISASECSGDEPIAPEVSNSLAMSPKRSDAVLNTAKVRDGTTSALGIIDEGLIATEGGMDLSNADDTSIDHSKAVADSEPNPSDIQEDVKKESHVCGFCGSSLGSEMDLVKHQKTHFINTESEASINASPCLDGPSRTCTEEEQFKCSICGKGFSDPNKLSAHKLIHSLDFMKCEVSGKAFRTTDDLQHHKQMHATERRFSCDVCSEAFNTRSSLLTHQTIRHPCNGPESSREVNQETRHVCGHCKEAFPCKQDLLEHETVHVDKKPLICRRCDKVFTSIRSLKSHMATHFRNKNYPCAKCGTSFKLYYQLHRHKQDHKDKPFSCDICRKMVKTQETLRNHFRHHEEEPLICDKCNKKFNTRVELNKHKRSHKTVEKRHGCDVCNKSFRRAAHLIKHKLSHKGTTSKNPHSCRFCQKSYSKVTHLNLHLQLTHDKVKPETSLGRSNRYFCGICSRSFETYFSMKKHKQMHKERPHMCYTCEGTFMVGAGLRRHNLRKCSNGYACEVCSKSFSTTHQLQSHSVKHISSKPYMCSFCHKCFWTTKQLRTHMLLHTGSKPHICQVCNKRFAEVEDLTRHKKICSIGMKSNMLSKTPKQAFDPHGIKQEGEPLHRYLSRTADQSGFEVSSRMDVTGNISGGEDYQSQTSDEQPVSVNARLTGVDVANSDKGHATLVEMSCTEIFDCPQQVSADGESSRASDTPNDAKSSTEEECLIGGVETKKLQVLLEKFVLYICDVCNRSFASQNLWAQHMKDHVDEVPQRDQLPKKFVQNPDQQPKQESPNASLVKKNQPNKPEARPLVKHEESGKRFSHDNGLKLQKKCVHSNEERHLCMGCGRTYKHKCHLREHWRCSKKCDFGSSNGYVLDAIKKLRCDICGEKFSSIEKYKDHITGHLDESPVKCETCGKRYNCKAGLEYHKNFLCNTTGPTKAGGEYAQPEVLNCEVCHKHFPDMRRFKDHLRSHSDARPFSCKKCGKSYKYARDVSTHQLKRCRRKITGNPKGKVTPERNRQNNKRGDLNQKVLSNSKPLVKNVQLDCKVCGKKLERVISQGTEHANMKCKICSSLKTDVSKEPTGKKRTTKPKETVQGPSGTNNATVKGTEGAQSKTSIQKFPCKICNHVFAYKTQLKKHERHHPEGKLFKCNKCSRGFTLLQTLQLHKRKSHAITHGRDKDRKKLKCQFCNIFFRFPYERERHENSHSTEKRYKCECGEAFKQKYELSSHQRLENHPKVHTGPDNVQRSISTQAARKTMSSGKPTQTRKDSKQNVLVGGIESLQARPQKPDPKCSDKNGKRSFRCNKCDRKFTLERVHKLHQQKCTALKCRFCNVLFNNLTSRESHEKIHTGHGDVKLHKCHCGKSYMNRTTLRRHLVKNPECSQLDQNRVEHSETGEPSASATVDQQQSPVVPFSCQKCNKGFMNQHELRRHEKTKKWLNGCTRVLKDKGRGQEEGVHLQTTTHQPRPSQQPQRVQEAVEKNVIHLPSGKNLVILKDNQKSNQDNASRYDVIMVQQPGTNRMLVESFKQYQQFAESTPFQQSAHSLDNLAQHEKSHIQEVHRCECGKLFKQKYELESHQITGHNVISPARQPISIGLTEGATPTRSKNFFRMSTSQTNKEAFAENGPTPRVVNEMFKCEVCAHLWYMKWTPENDYKEKQHRACPSCGTVFSYKFHVKVSKKNIPQTKSVFKPTDKSHQSEGIIEDLPPLRSKDAFHVRSYQTSPVDDVCSLTRGEPLRQTRRFAHSEKGEESAKQKLTIEDNGRIDLSEFTVVNDVRGGSKDFNEESNFSSTQSNLVDLQEVPGPERIRACRFCGKFFMKTYIVEHEQSHSNKVLVHLNTNDADKEGLNKERVIQGVHRSDGYNKNTEKADSTKMKQRPYISKPYHCERCGHRFEKKYQLVTHATYFCNELEQEATTEETKKSTKGELSLLKCGVCSTFFNSMPLLVEHMKGHK